MEADDPSEMYPAGVVVVTIPYRGENANPPTMTGHKRKLTGTHK
jgi:hypothetical protein